MKILKEFREFAVKGNVVDLAVAVVLGAAFTKIVTAFTDSIIMPLISLVAGKRGIAELRFKVVETVFPIGRFLQTIIDFIIVAMVLFLLVKAINKLNRKKEEAAAQPKQPEYTLSEKLLMEIRDSVKK